MGERENTVMLRKLLHVIVFDAEIFVTFMGYEKLEQLLRTTSAQQQSPHTHK